MIDACKQWRGAEFGKQSLGWEPVSFYRPCGSCHSFNGKENHTEKETMSGLFLLRTNPKAAGLVVQGKLARYFGE